MRSSRLRGALVGVVVAAAIPAAGCTGHRPAGAPRTVSGPQVRRLASEIVLEMVTSRPRLVPAPGTAQRSRCPAGLAALPGAAAWAAPSGPGGGPVGVGRLPRGAGGAPARGPRPGARGVAGGGPGGPGPPPAPPAAPRGALPPGPACAAHRSRRFALVWVPA